MQILGNAELTKRLKALEQAFFASRNREVSNTYTSEDAKNNIDNTKPQVDNNTVGVAENDGAIMDVAELSDENATAIEELAALVDELMERVEALEG